MCCTATRLAHVELRSATPRSVSARQGSTQTPAATPLPHPVAAPAQLQQKSQPRVEVATASTPSKPVLVIPLPRSRATSQAPSGSATPQLPQVAVGEWFELVWHTSAQAMTRWAGARLSPKTTSITYAFARPDPTSAWYPIVNRLGQPIERVGAWPPHPDVTVVSFTPLVVYSN